MRTRKQIEKESKKDYHYLSQLERIVELLLDIRDLLVDLKTRKIKRKPSEYNKFFAKKVKEGIPLTEIGKLWKKHKEANK